MSEFDLDQSDKYCIFQCCDETLGIPAVLIRNVSSQLELSSVPMADPVLAGLAYVHKEFLPVFDISSMISPGSPTPANYGQQTLVISSDQGAWAILIDMVLGLESLEISYTGTRNNNSCWGGANIGSATYRDRFVSIVDPDILYRNLSQRLQNLWQMMDDTTQSPVGELQLTETINS